METTAINDEHSNPIAPGTLPVVQQNSNVIDFLQQEESIEPETQCEGGVCMLAWKPKRPPRTAA